MESPKYMGFNTTQINTLRRLLAEAVASEDALQDLQDQIDALEGRVTALETP